ncbi:VCBS repeat-containing protein [Prevotella sp. A2931]|uniref:VCBS repeat-containing protein n=1 Tax=Prevotella illustrans TaxID=2800387 RepID=A0ABS3M5Q7_9BACT|nr:MULTISPECIES: FG-GAP-like repeat-containing protein [Prevotella]MBO1363513.1 VCBS repeat-containing protein [Prevotella illustrans]PTL25983.1 hypothetical protein C3V39_02215 [Prevotella sp. oral taxon 820]
MNVCLSSITSSCNNSVYRKYTLEYDGRFSKKIEEWARLVKVVEENGKGEALPPVILNWNIPTDSYIRTSKINVSTSDSRSYIEEGEKSFLAVDLTGDGISDIVRMSPVKVVEAVWNGGKKWHNETCVYISRSRVGPAGNVTYENPIVFSLPASFSMGDLDMVIGGTSAMDFDGDGYNDLVMPYHNQADGHWNEEDFYIILGADVVAGRAGRVKVFPIQLQTSDDKPLFTILDTDGNGKDDVICVERDKKDGFYPATIVKLKDGTQLDRTEFKITLPDDPKRMFVGDYNNDGLSDLIFLYDDGYKIYYNNGGTPTAVKFAETSTKSGTDFCDHWRVLQGDFDGDGLIDFVYNVSGESYLWIAHNNGDGTFTSSKTVNIGVVEGFSGKDDDRFSISVCDINHDGRSDVMVAKSQYKKGSFPGYKTKYVNTPVKWLVSTGRALELIHSYIKDREEDAREITIFMGDFDGDGYMELANYGSKLNSTDDTFDEKINVYKIGDGMSSFGKIVSIMDGMDNTSRIQYAYTTNPLVYKRTLPQQYPVNTYTLPLSVVAMVTVDDGAVGSRTTKYFYEDLRIHIAGRGMLGFNTVIKENTTLGTREVTDITRWDEKHWVPTEVKITNTIGGSSSVVITKSTIAEQGKRNYFAYVAQKDVTDLDGNTATTITHYDVEKGVVTDETVKNGGEDMYKKVSYSGFQNKAGAWLPTTLTMIQKHKDDSSPFTTVTTYGYDDKGNTLTTTINSGTGLALKTTSTYDVYGNVLSSVATGSGVKAVTKCNDYDPSGRFIVKTYTYPASAVNTFTYDIWGNLLTESDVTDPSNPLTAKHTYDGWGRKLSLLAPDGTLTAYETGWGTADAKKYYVKEATIGKPAVTTWYDKGGHEVLRESTGIRGVPVVKTTAYNHRGEVTRISNKTGLLVITQTLAYDERGRVVSEESSSGKSTSYTYGNRTVTSTTAGHSYTKTTDAWGNVIKATDPVGEVTYTYFSNGKPSRVKTNGSTVTMDYDAAGNQTKLTDPDAGTTTYTYAADGALLTQIDGRGIKTSNTYDDLGRLSSARLGQHTVTYVYGTSGNEKLRLVSKAMGGNAVEYTHDRFGRVIAEKRSISGNGTFVFSYEYNSKNQLAKTRYPGGLEVTYSYDDNGFKTETAANGSTINKQESYNGLVTANLFKKALRAVRRLDGRGFECNAMLINGATQIECLTTEYEGTTGNLLSRKRNQGLVESFEYDNLDRLTGVKEGNTERMRISYAPNGNILSKTGVGNYSYEETNYPHAVAEVDNTDGKIPSDVLTTSFNDFGKIQLIADEGKKLRMDFVYGPDRERWISELSKDGADIRTTIYAGNYEKVTEKGITHEFYYLDGNTILIKENGAFKSYLAFTDNLGSIISVIDENGAKVFEASYDAWGRQTVTLNSIGLHRGYTRHEMLNEFDIINMNGRLYDPVLGRFFSPDNYVQLPDNSQSFNRYSYCLNNPLKYTDHSGELFGIDDAVFAFALFGVANSMMQAAYNGKNVLSAGLLSLAYSAATYGIGSLLGNVGGLGRELLRAGMHGLAGGLYGLANNEKFGSSFLSGALSSGIGSFAQGVHINGGLMLASTTTMGGLAAWVTGGDFLQGAIQGMMIGALNHAQHDQYDPMNNPEAAKVRSRNRIKKDPKYKQKIISEIQKDGKLSFEEAFYWYGYGDGSDIYVDASKLDLEKIDITNRKVGEHWSIQTLTSSGNYSVGLVYGRITVEYQGNNSFRILPDTYDFDIHTDNFFNWHTIKRNIETIGAGILHGTGTPFKIIFNGLYHNK